MSKTSSAVKNKYNAKAYDQIPLRVPKGRKQAIQDVAQARGESLNGFVTTAIDERIARLEDTIEREVSSDKPDNTENTWEIVPDGESRWANARLENDKKMKRNKSSDK